MLSQIFANGSLRKRFTVNGFARFKSTMSFRAQREILERFLTFVRNDTILKIPCSVIFKRSEKSLKDSSRSFGMTQY